MMQIPQLKMESTMAKINIQQNNTELEIEQPKATLSIEQRQADVSIETKKGKLTIDQSQAWEEMNLESTFQLNMNHAQDSRQAVAEGTARRAEQGAELVDIHRNPDILANQAEVNGHRQMKTLSIKYIPSPFAVKFDYEPAEVNVNIRENKPNIDVDINQPIVNVHYGNIEVAMEQYANLHIYLDSHD